jgi:hypothetical protein
MQKKFSKIAFGALCAATLPLMACQETTGASAATEQQKMAFTDSCSQAGGTVYVTPGCNGTAKCKGAYLDLDNGQVSYNQCAGKNSCRGIQCLEPNSMSSSAMSSSSMTMSSSMMSSSATQSSSSVAPSPKEQLLASPSLTAFKETCDSVKGKYASADCTGHNTCAGIYFHTGSYGTKVGSTEVSCSGMNKCAGAKCEI